MTAQSTTNVVTSEPLKLEFVGTTSPRIPGEEFKSQLQARLSQPVSTESSGEQLRYLLQREKDEPLTTTASTATTTTAASNGGVTTTTRVWVPGDDFPPLLPPHDIINNNTFKNLPPKCAFNARPSYFFNNIFVHLMKE